MSFLYQFSNQKYLNIETFRKNGIGVKTPVWFVQDGNKIFIQTIAESGKVKRIRNNEKVNIAPCKMDGTLIGEWQPAIGKEVKETDISKKVNRMLNQKYGLMKALFGLTATLKKTQNTIIEVKKEE